MAVALGTGFLVVVVAAGLLLNRGGRGIGKGDANPDTAAFSKPFRSVNLSRPDALIVTKSLSELPRDILKQPLLKKLLTEDFVFYYESSEGFLGLKGTLRRIAYENNLTLADEVLSYVLRAPAELALWKSYDGKLNQFMLVLKRPGLGELLEMAAKVAAKDSQLTMQGEQKVAGVGKVSIYKLRYSHNDELFFGGFEGQLYVFSNPEITLPSPEDLKKWREDAKTNFGKNKNDGVFSLALEPEDDTSKHAIYLSAAYLSFGYQAFFPVLEAIKFRYARGEWEAYALTGSAAVNLAVDPSLLWAAAPRSPSVCIALPVDFLKVEDLLKLVYTDKQKEISALAGTLKSPVGICWYPQSALYTPLIIAKTSATLNTAFLGEFFARAVGGNEAGILSEQERELYLEQQKDRAEGKKVEDPVKASVFESPFPVEEKTDKRGTVWSREVSSRYGFYEQSQSRNAQKMRSKKFIRVSAALRDDTLLFSADDRLVENSLSVMDKKYPAVADSLPRKGSKPGLILFPEKIAELIKQAALQSLPAEQESVFRESVSRRLFPALEKIKEFPACAVPLPSFEEAGPWKWERLKCQ